MLIFYFSVVICPLSVTDGWVSEIVKFTPKLEVFKYVGDKEYRRNLRLKVHEHVTGQSSTLNVSALYFHRVIESGWLLLKWNVSVVV